MHWGLFVDLPIATKKSADSMREESPFAPWDQDSIYTFKRINDQPGRSTSKLSSVLGVTNNDLNFLYRSNRRAQPPLPAAPAAAAEPKATKTQSSNAVRGATVSPSTSLSSDLNFSPTPGSPQSTKRSPSKATSNPVGTLGRSLIGSIKRAPLNISNFTRPQMPSFGVPSPSGPVPTSLLEPGNEPIRQVQSPVDHATSLIGSRKKQGSTTNLFDVPPQQPRKLPATASSKARAILGVASDGSDLPLEPSQTLSTTSSTSMETSNAALSTGMSNSSLSISSTQLKKSTLKALNRFNRSQSDLLDNDSAESAQGVIPEKFPSHRAEGSISSSFSKSTKHVEAPVVRRTPKPVEFWGVLNAKDVGAIRASIRQEYSTAAKHIRQIKDDPTLASTGKFLMRVYFGNQSLKSFTIPTNSSAGQVVQTIVEKLGLNDKSENYGICEYTPKGDIFLIQSDENVHEIQSHWVDSEIFIFKRIAQAENAESPGSSVSSVRLRANAKISAKLAGFFGPNKETANSRPPELEELLPLLDIVHNDAEVYREVVNGKDKILRFDRISNTNGIPSYTIGRDQKINYGLELTIYRIGRGTNFMFHRVIGNGKFGKVVLLSQKHGSKVYAVKIVPKKGQDGRAIASQEVDIMQSIHHPFIIGLHFAVETCDRLYLVMDYVNGGEFYFHLSNSGRFSENRTLFYATELLLALQYLHSKGIIYRDIKLENILLAKDGHIRIADFGLSKHEGNNSTAENIVGTAEYLPPEVISGRPFTFAGDWWAYGIALYEMLTACHPFYTEDRRQLYSNLMHARIEYPSYLSSAAKELLSGLLERDPRARLGNGRDGASEVMRQPFFRTVNWEQMEKKEVAPPFLPEIIDDNDVKFFASEYTNEAVLLMPMSRAVQAV